MTADKGKPWVMCEAYQFVIKAQVDALIKLGVNPKLKVIYLYMYIRLFYWSYCIPDFVLQK